jgi:HSP20 family protein
MSLFLKNREPDLETIDEFDRLQRELSRFFNFGVDDIGLYDRPSALAADLIENADGFELLVDLPGVDKKDLELSVDNNVLSLKGEKKETKESKGSFRRETWTGSFRRTIPLPQSADPEKVRAELKDGILTVAIGKREELKPRQIAVNVR